jgi:ribosomal protein S18 acetylase RimI-like enzyme
MVKCYVSPDYRSGNVADTLMGMALKRAVSQGFDAIWLLVWKENPRAVRFYTKHGFAAIGTQPVWVGDIAFDDHIMKKVLTS